MTLPPAEQLRIIVLGYIVRRPLGGGAWSTLQYALGLHCMGHDVFFFEDSEDYPACYDPTRHVTDADPTFGLAFAADVFDKVGLGDRWTYYDAHTDTWLGPCAGTALSICADADLVITASGRLRPWTLDIEKRAFVDKDPLFVQVRHIQDPERRAVTAQHTSFFTYGWNIGLGTSRVPDDGLAWESHRQPVVLDQWAPAPVPASTASESWRKSRFTTIMQWDAYAPVEHAGLAYGMKSASFRPYESLPRCVGEILELAVGGSGVPKSRLRELGWRIVDPLEPTRTPWTYQEYLAASRGEFTVAKHGYVTSRCGWFSERSANYLASGRPVVTQETGFSDWLPTGEGLLSFTTPDDAAAAIEAVCSDYARHCRAARELVEAHFDSGKVMGRLLEIAMR